MTMKSAVLLIVFCVALVACSSSAPPPPTAPDPAQKTVIDAQLKALQRAKDVQNVVDDQKKKQDKNLEDQGG
jgi:uncharacterized protein YcfL